MFFFFFGLGIEWGWAAALLSPPAHIDYLRAAANGLYVT